MQKKNKFQSPPTRNHLWESARRMVCNWTSCESKSHGQTETPRLWPSYLDRLEAFLNSTTWCLKNWRLNTSHFQHTLWAHCSHAPLCYTPSLIQLLGQEGVPPRATRVQSGATDSTRAGAIYLRVSAPVPAGHRKWMSLGVTSSGWTTLKVNEKTY